MERAEQRGVVIVGAGHGGAQAAIALRQHGYEGAITLVGDEPDPPYERPPLSKDYLAGKKSFDRILLRPLAFWSDRRIDLRLGRRIVALDPVVQTVTDDAGTALGYDRLIWATGGAPRRMGCDGHSLPGTHAIRTRGDVDRLLGELPAARRVVVIGGGYIGLEAAAALIDAGKSVTLLEAQDRLLARVAGPALSRFYADEHRSRGVDLRLGVEVACILGEERVAGVRLSTGEVIEADLAIVGIGIVPAVAPLLAAGAAGDDGVSVDAACRTSLPHVLAVGDCASHPNRYADGARIRIESVQNANDQATVAARTILGEAARYDAVPWFWSNQYDLKLQTVGLSTGHDSAVVRGDPASRSFSVIYGRDGHVVALDCVNAVRDYVQGRRLVTERSAIDPATLADTSVPLKDM